MSKSIPQRLVVPLSLLSTAVSAGWIFADIAKGAVPWSGGIALLASLTALAVHEPIEARLAAAPSAHDVALFEEFSRVFPADPAVRLLREMDFGNSFRKREIQPVIDFVETWDLVDKQFIDSVLEIERRTLYETANEFVWELVKRTVPIGINGEFVSVISDNFRASGRPRTPQLIEDAKVLNASARLVVPAYERFIRQCRTRLRS